MTHVYQQPNSMTGKFLVLSFFILATCVLGASPAAAQTTPTVGYWYKYYTNEGGSYTPPTGSQVEGPYMGLSAPAERQACTTLGYTYVTDSFTPPHDDPAGVLGPNTCYEHYDMNGTIYDFDGAGQDKTYYYDKPLPPSPPIQASCSVSPTSITVGGSATWTASASGGTGSYTYNWTGSEGLSGFSQSVGGSYGSAGTKTASVTVTSGGQSVTVGCSNSLTVNANVPTASLSANPISITTGQSSTLTHSCTNASFASISSVGNVSSSGGTTGVSPGSTTTYTLTCSGSGGTATSNVTIYVTPPPIQASCSVSPTSVAIGGSATWTATRSGGNGSYTYNWTGSEGLSGFSQSVGGSYGSPGTKTASVTVTSGGQSVTVGCSNSLTVNANVPTASLSASPTSILVGQNANLIYSCSNATSASISGVGAVSPSGGSTAVSPGSTTTYTLTCTGAGGTATSNATLTVTTPTLAGSCSVSPTSITVGGTATWTAAPSGGTGSYTYNWSGSEGLSGYSQSVGGSYGSAGTKTAGVTITSGAQSTYVACSNSLSVGVPPAPDLTAGATSPASATVGQPVTFSASAINQGNAASGGFPMLFDVPGVGLFNSSYSGGLAAGGSQSMSASVTFPSAGQYQVRACANYNTGWTAITTESNYGNNCGPYTTVTVASPPITASCSVSPTSITVGGSATWTASASGGNGSYTYNWTGSENLSGYSQSVGGSYGSEGTKTASVTVSSGGQSTTVACANSLAVGAAPAPDLIAGVTSPSGATAGSATTFSGSVSNIGSGPSQAFPTIFQVENVTTQSSGTVGGLAAGGSSGVSSNYTFPSAGTYRVRFCANMNSATMAIIVFPETNYGNNCGGWTSVSVGPAAPPPPTGLTHSCNASGSQVTLSWNPASGASDYYVRMDTRGVIWPAQTITDFHPATSITYNVTPGQVYTWWVHANNASGYSAYTSSSFSCAGTPDLTAGATSPASATVGQPVTFSASAINQGNAASGGFPMLFDVPGVGLFNSSYSGGLAAGGSQSMSASVTFPSAGQYQVRACANYNTGWTAITTESNYGNNCGPYTTVTVSEVPQQPPDLTAGVASPSSAVAGTAATFSANVSNIGSGPSQAFPTIFQVENVTTQSSGTVGGLAAGGSSGVSSNYTFPSAGTYRVRFCANMNSATMAIIVFPETNYGNNCGGWTSVSVTNPQPTGTLSCTVDQSNPTPGSTVNYTVTPSGGATGPYSWDDTQGGSYGSGATISRFIATEGLYIMSVNGQNVMYPGSCPVVSGGCVNPEATITATPDRVVKGTTTQLSWSASGVDGTCTITGTDGYSTAVNAASCTVPRTTVTRTINDQTTYTISCENGAATAQVIVNVIPRFNEF